MLVLNRRRKLFLKLETVYFPEHYESYETDADIVLFYLSRENAPGARVFNTLRIHLSKSEEELFGEISSTTRKGIRQAEKDGAYPLFIDGSPGVETVMQFCDSYDSFAVQKGIKCADRELLLMARSSGSLSISGLKDREGRDLCGTADIHDSKIALGMYSYSHFRKFEDKLIRKQISNANRLLYWELIKYYRRAGLEVFDLGGLGMGMESKDLDTVDEFKRSFGGRIETLYHFYHGTSRLGRLVLSMSNKNNKIEY